jgi:hypothetical protein
MAIGRSRALRWTTANPHRIALVKVDVEEHEVSVIRGMRNLIERDHPILRLSKGTKAYPEFLAGYGYRMRPKTSGSIDCRFGVRRGAHARRWREQGRRRKSIPRDLSESGSVKKTDDFTYLDLA